MFNFIKTHKVLSLLSILLLVLILGYLFFFKSNMNQQSTIPTYRSITPGTSTKEQVIEKLGKPLEDKQIGNNEILTFDSGKTVRPDEYYFQNGVNSLVKEIIPFDDERKIESIRTKYGNANLVLYGEGSVGGFYLFVYLDRGVAYIGNPVSGSLLELWYFTPLSEQEFIKNWAQGYSKTQPSPHEDSNLEF